MYMETSEEFYMANFKNDIWSVFHCLMEEYSVFKAETMQKENIWCFSPDSGESPSVYYAENVMNVLLKEGIISESDDLPEFFDLISKRYVLTEKGQELAKEFKDTPPEKAMYDFLSRITITREDRF